MKIDDIDIKKIKAYKNNAKIHTEEQIKRIGESLKRFGWQQNIVVDKDYTIIIGHCRYLAAKKLGMKTVPVQFAENLTEEEIKALRIADNRLNESEWNMNLIEKELECMSLDLSGLLQFEEKIKGIDPKKELKTEKIEPYTRHHFLISCEPDQIDEVMNVIKGLEGREGIEVDNAAN